VVLVQSNLSSLVAEMYSLIFWLSAVGSILVWMTLRYDVLSRLSTVSVLLPSVHKTTVRLQRQGLFALPLPYPDRRWARDAADPSLRVAEWTG
jgi:hypothetical protein